MSARQKTQDLGVNNINLLKYNLHITTRVFDNNISRVEILCNNIYTFEWRFRTPNDMHPKNSGSLKVQTTNHKISDIFITQLLICNVQICDK